MSVSIFVPREREAGERRCAASPDSVAALIKLGCQVRLESGAGGGAFFSDEAFAQAGAQVVSNAACAAEAAAVLCVQLPGSEVEQQLAEHTLLVAMFSTPVAAQRLNVWQSQQVSALSMNRLPRTSRAQKMDALSSQASIAGYKAALLAADHLPRYLPLMMTAAGTIRPAKVVILGAGVAGLQAIATAKRLGAQVWASDVRLATREEVHSLGARFIDVPGSEDLQDERGYAKAASADFLRRQAEVVGEHIAGADAVITTAAVQGRKAPRLIDRALVERMRPGSVIVDLAAEQGGNCECTVAGETARVGGVCILGPTNVPSKLPVDATRLYAANVLALMRLVIASNEIKLDLNDPILDAALVTHQGECRDPGADQ